jgi:hypothetical protein
LGHPGQVRAAQHRHSIEVTRTLQLIDKWGNESTVDREGQLNRIKHQKVLAVLERRALRYRCGVGRGRLEVRSAGADSINDTGTVETEGLNEEASGDDELDMQLRAELRQ